MKKRLLIIKPDHIGDYIVFRNFLQTFSEDTVYGEYEICLLLNERVRQLAEFLDSSLVAQFFFIDLEKYALDNWFTKRKNQEVLESSYEVVINAMFTRIIPLEEFISTIKCKRKFLIRDDAHDVKRKFQEMYDEHYTDIFNLSDYHEFEFERFKLAFELILNKKIKLQRTEILLDDVWQNEVGFEGSYCIFFIGADDEFRKWNIYNYIQIAQYILLNTNFNIILCGGAQEIQEAEEIEHRVVDKRLLNLVGQTSLVDVVSLIAKARLIISNETGAAHIAAALDIYTLVISNGNHFGKFTPYPKHYTNRYFAVYPFVYDEKTFESFKSLYYKSSTLNIDDITVKMVLDQLEYIFFLANVSSTKLHCIEQKELACLYFSPTQINLNYTFSAMYSHLFKTVAELQKHYEKIAVYGYSSVGRTIAWQLGDKFCAFIDRNADDIRENKEPLFTIYQAKELDYDCIIIAVLGRENEVEKELVETYGFDTKKIVKLQIRKGRYDVRTK